MLQLLLRARCTAPSTAQSLATSASSQWPSRSRKYPERERGRDPRRPGANKPRETRDGEPIPRLEGEGVYGVHSVLQALESRHRDVYALYLRDPEGAGAPSKKKSAADVQAFERIKELAAESRLPVSFAR